MKPKKSAGCNTPKTLALKEYEFWSAKVYTELAKKLGVSIDPKSTTQKAINAFVDAFNAKPTQKPIVNLLEVRLSDRSALIVMLLDRLPQYGVETLGKTELVDEWLKAQGIKYCSAMFKWN